jgi:hypothetical protein
MVEPHRVRDVDHQTTMPDGVGLGVSGYLGAHDSGPHTPDLMLAEPGAKTRTLDSSRYGVS